MLSILAFIFGCSIGSFVQVVASRLHVAPIMKGRSKCLSCGEALHLSDLVPILSYIFLKGKCRYCKSTYGVESIIIEVLFGITFLLLYKIIIIGQPTLLLGAFWLTYYTFLFGVLGVMAIYDKAHSYIPFQFLYSYLGLCSLMWTLRMFENPSIVTFLSPLFVAFPFLILWLVTKGKGLGFGDVIIFFGVGAFFGSLEGFAVFILSVWVGAVFGLYYKYITKRHSRKPIAIPFVPFIVLAFLIVLFTGVDIFSIAMLFS